MGKTGKGNSRDTAKWMAAYIRKIMSGGRGPPGKKGGSLTLIRMWKGGKPVVLLVGM